MDLRTARLLATLGSAALLVPAAAMAKSDNSGSGSASSGRNSKNYVQGDRLERRRRARRHREDVVVVVSGGNRRARDYAGQTVSFDLSAARIKVDDVNGDGVENLADVVTCDKVTVQARLARDGSSVEPFPARKLQVKYPEPEDETEIEPAARGASPKLTAKGCARSPRRTHPQRHSPQRKPVAAGSVGSGLSGRPGGGSGWL